VDVFEKVPIIKTEIHRAEKRKRGYRGDLKRLGKVLETYYL
jgi:hypothetical protein